ncbi:MAG: hypothetical protein J0L82_03775 [Deltaproteobacteria bacterium]|nr:hypothetical protein [Deltaproteobacteria bacterium]
MITSLGLNATDGGTNRRTLNATCLKLNTDSQQAVSKHHGRFAGDARVGALIALTFMVILVSVAPNARAADEFEFSAEIYTQTMYRPEERLDRPHGVFHETRLRSSLALNADSKIKFDFGSYLLAEWSEASQASSSFTNTSLSPFVGSHWRNSWNLQSTLGSSTASLTLQFEGRYREPVSDFSRSTGVKGWDPRTGAAVGVWHQFNSNFFLDIYADLFYAPKYSAAPMSTAIARVGNRHTFSATSETSWKPFGDLYFELFQQNAMNIELGTKRSEGRAGVAIGASRESGTVQLRVYNGWPLESDRDSRSRLEALLVGGFSL